MSRMHYYCRWLVYQLICTAIMNTPFSIVNFPEEDLVEIVSTSWIISEAGVSVISYLKLLICF